jgi:hypothetical protein
MNKHDKIIFIKEIAQLEGGCIMIDKIFSNFDIKFVTSDGTVVDYTKDSRKHIISLHTQDDDYVDFVYNLVNDANYSVSPILDSVKVISDILNKEGGSIFLNQSIDIHGYGYGLNGFINIEIIDKILMIRTYSVPSKLGLHSYSKNIFLIENPILEFVLNEIQNNNYL